GPAPGVPGAAPGAAPGAPPSPFGPAPGVPGAAPGAPPSPFGGPATGVPGAAPGAPGAAPGATPGTGDTPPAAGTGETPPAQPTPADEEQERWLALMEQTNLSGSTGLLHSAYAGSGPAGTFRVGFLSDWFTAGSFLCRPGDIAVPPGGKLYPKGMDKSCKQ